ncbi:MAG: hypothetical protein GDA42_08915 [Ekhidna sp.]|nr:hypothetical protein [Ekhidna sp.]
MKKPVIYITVIVVLLTANLYLFLNPRKGINNAASNRYFDGVEKESLSRISFTNNDQVVSMVKSENGWLLDDSLRVDREFFNTLLIILDKVETLGKISTWAGDTLGEIELVTSKEVVKLQYAVNPTKTKAFFIDGSGVSEVSVPGYRDNVIGIFELHPDQWRDRLILDAGWRTIQRIKVDYQNAQDIVIQFDNTFFLVNGQPPRDSSALVDYLNQFQYFQANEIVSKGRFPRFDSLMATQPTAQLTIDEINNEDRLSMKIFPPLSGQNYHLVTTGNRMMVIDGKRVNNLLPELSDFFSD